jgi:hypothetical protein
MFCVSEGSGAHYVPHRDNVCVDAHGEVDCHNSREVTAILYTSDVSLTIW